MKRVLGGITIVIILILTACGSLAVQGDVMPAAEATRRHEIATPAATAANQPMGTESLPPTPTLLPTPFSPIPISTNMATPISLGSWNSLGLETEDISALAIDPSMPTTLYAGTDGYSGANGGVFKSTDGGTSWVNTGLTTSCVQALAIDPTAPTTLYAGTLLDGVFKSTDGGASWTNTGSLVGGVAKLVIDRTMPNTLYAETYNVAAGGAIGVFKSTDGGENWVKISADTGGLVIDPTMPTTLYVETASKGMLMTMLRSTNGGEDWVQIAADTIFEILAIDPTTPTILYAGTDDGVFVIHQEE